MLRARLVYTLTVSTVYSPSRINQDFFFIVERKREHKKSPSIEINRGRLTLFRTHLLYNILYDARSFLLLFIFFFILCLLFFTLTRSPQPKLLCFSVIRITKNYLYLLSIDTNIGYLLRFCQAVSSQMDDSAVIALKYYIVTIRFCSQYRIYIHICPI